MDGQKLECADRLWEKFRVNFKKSFNSSVFYSLADRAIMNTFHERLRPFKEWDEVNEEIIKFGVSEVERFNLLERTQNSGKFCAAYKAIRLVQRYLLSPDFSVYDNYGMRTYPRIRELIQIVQPINLNFEFFYPFGCLKALADRKSQAGPYFEY